MPFDPDLFRSLGLAHVFRNDHRALKIDLAGVTSPSQVYTIDADQSANMWCRTGCLTGSEDLCGVGVTLRNTQSDLAEHGLGKFSWYHVAPFQSPR